MNNQTPKTAPATGPIAAAIYYIVFILLFPALVVGYVLWVGKMIVSGRGSGVSSTAQALLSARWLQHKLGARPDEPSNRLLMALPGVSPAAIWLVYGPMLLAHRLSGYLPKSMRYPFEGEVTIQNQGLARQTFYDRVVEQRLGEIAQLVILGAGFDTRALRLPKGTSVRSFEVDTPGTQAVKRAMLEKAGIDTSGVAFAAADFEKDDWLERLVAAGFDPGKPALFLWEGVTPYLDRQAVEDTLHKIAGTAKGSSVAFDYFTTEVLESGALMMRYVRLGTQAAGEPLKFGIDSTPPSGERLAELLKSCGLAVCEQHTLGEEMNGKRAWGGFAEAKVE